jgi:ketosteroid isomerase-like protein
VSEANKELVRAGLADVQVFWDMLDEYVVWDLRAWPTLDLDDIYFGRDAVIAGSRKYWGAWDEYEIEAEELFDAGQSVVAILHERGRGKGSRVPVERHHPQLWTFREGRIVRWESFETRSKALKAVELDK